jgi:hypothetical protein
MPRGVGDPGPTLGGERGMSATGCLVTLKRPCL